MNSIYVFDRTFLGKTIRNEWSLEKLINQINTEKCSLEFLRQFIDYNTRVIECTLRQNRKPYWRECVVRIAVSKVNYYWNRLREDCTW